MRTGNVQTAMSNAQTGSNMKKNGQNSLLPDGQKTQRRTHSKTVDRQMKQYSQMSKVHNKLAAAKK